MLFVKLNNDLGRNIKIKYLWRVLYFSKYFIFNRMELYMNNNSHNQKKIIIAENIMSSMKESERLAEEISRVVKKSNEPYMRKLKKARIILQKKIKIEKDMLLKSKQLEYEKRDEFIEFLKNTVNETEIRLNRLNEEIKRESIEEDLKKLIDELFEKDCFKTISRYQNHDKTVSQEELKKSLSEAEEYFLHADRQMKKIEQIPNIKRDNLDIKNLSEDFKKMEKKS